MMVLLSLKAVIGYGLLVGGAGLLPGNIWRIHLRIPLWKRGNEMTSEKAIEVLKSAILLEMRGENFYRTVADQAADADVKEFFTLMATEEENHKEILSSQLRELTVGRSFLVNPSVMGGSSKVSDGVLSAKVKSRIGAAGFEAAAISAAMAMEQAAVALYGGRAAETLDPQEKELYQWLTRWEQTHLHELSEMDSAIRESVWNDAGFWPY
ncbi:ferritin family protein [Myxococcota bacterium]|nr:ferritin family protein [Myxococcota bacterium]